MFGVQFYKRQLAQYTHKHGNYYYDTGLPKAIENTELDENRVYLHAGHSWNIFFL